MKVKELKRLLEELDDDDVVIVSESNASPKYKITHIEDSTCVGVYELRITDFGENESYWD